MNDPIIEVKAALDGIGALIDLIDCSGSDQHNLALLPLFLAEQKRAAAALTQMEQPAKMVRAQVLDEAAKRLLELAREERNLDGATLSRAAEFLADHDRMEPVEEAAKVADSANLEERIAARIRALKEQP